MPSTTSTRKEKALETSRRKQMVLILKRIRITGYDTYYYTGTSEKMFKRTLMNFMKKHSGMK